MLAIGSLYLLWGITGFLFLSDPSVTLTGRDTNEGPLGLEVNGVQNFLHIVVAVAALVSATSERAARIGGIWLLVAGIGLAAVGIIGVVQPDLNFLSANTADTVVHVVTALVGLAVLVGPARTPEGQKSEPYHETG